MTNPGSRDDAALFSSHTCIGKVRIADAKGEVLRDADQAWEVARALIMDLLKEKPEHLLLLTASLEVTGEDGEIVLEFPFAEAMCEPPTDEPPTKH